jgi:signal transduction histidine kinase
VIVAVQVADVVTSQIVLRTSLMIAIPLLVAVLAVIAWYVIGWTLRPVEQLRQGAERIGAGVVGSSGPSGGDPQRLPVPAARDEIQALALTLNDMLGRLAAGRARQRTFVADAAHELRSPLASMRTQLEVARHLGEAGELPDDLLPEVDRLAALVEDLLLLARADADAPLPARVDEVGVADLLDQVVVGYRDARVLVVVGDSDPDAAVVASADELRRAITNLVDNAVRHARTRVELVAVRAGRDVLVTVTDDGPGIPPADRERVFDRFTRLDDGRARDAGGLGLGLSMVKEITEQHGGTVTIEDAPIGGARLRVRLPAA